MTDVRSMTIEELKDFFDSLGEKPYRAKQLFHWLHQKKIRSFDEMTDFSKALREKLKTEASLVSLTMVRRQESALDGTKKYLFSLPDGKYIESVFMPYHHGNSVCVSSQAGCRMGCKFCASTLDGLERNLTPSEILEQIYEIERDTHERVSHCVVMGSGEPFDNYDNVVRFLRLITDPEGNDMSVRNITVSTCGLVPGIDAFAKEDLGVTLALSLHAPNQALRETLMPAAKRYDLREVMAACDRYYESTHRRMTYEYALMHGINDSLSQAKELAELLKGRNAHVNLIPVNPVKERDFQKPDQESISSFLKMLEKNGINATIRRTMGSDIDGACGQLKYRTAHEA